MGGRIDGLIGGLILMDDEMDYWKELRMNGWMDGWIEGWMHGWMGGGVLGSLEGLSIDPS